MSEMASRWRNTTDSRPEPGDLCPPQRDRHGALRRAFHLVATIGSLVFLTILYSAVWLSLAVVIPTVVLGHQPFVITSGSMEPAIRPGDVVLARPTDGKDLHTGTVVVFTDVRGDLVTHRITAVHGDGTYSTRGDANSASDTSPLDPDNIRGVGAILVPFIARPVVAVQAGRRGELAGLIGLVLLLALARAPGRRNDESPAPQALRRGLGRVNTTTCVVVVVAALTLGPTSAAAFTAFASTAGEFGATAIAPPTDLQAEGVCSGATRTIVLSWQPSPDSGAQSVMRSESAGGPYAEIGSVDRAVDTFEDTHQPAAGGDTYYYVVRALGPGGWHADSAEASAIVPANCGTDGGPPGGGPPGGGPPGEGGPAGGG
jgi:signal peptidase I